MKIKSIVIALVTLLFIFPTLAGAAAVGKLTSVEGKVDITSPGREARPAGEGDALNVGDIIRAKSKSRCEVTFGDGNILRLAENTRLKITAYMFEKDKRDEVLNLFRGKIQNIVQKMTGAADPGKAGRYEIHTPTAVAGVRGTNFFAYHQAGVSGAIFKEGTGYGYSINRPQEVRTITPGQAMVVTNPNQPPTVRQATTQEMEQHQKETAPAEKKAKDDAKKDGDDKKTDASAAKADDGNGKKDDQDKKPEEGKKADDGNGKKDDQDKKPEEGKKAEGDKAPESGAPKADEAKKAGDNGKPEQTVALRGGEARPPEGGNIGGEGKPQPLTKQGPDGQPLTRTDKSTVPVFNPMGPIFRLPDLPPALSDLGPRPRPFIRTPDPSIFKQPIFVPFTPPDTLPPAPDMKAHIYASGAFTHTIDNGLFLGIIDAATGAITTTVGGTMRDSTPVEAAGGHLSQGAFTNGTTFAGYFMGLPANASTARALVRSIYVTDTGDAGFLNGPMIGGFTANTFGGVGTAKQSPSLGTTSLAPANLEGAMDASGWTFARPHFGNITVGGASAPLSIAAGTAEGEVHGITLDSGKKIGVWGVITNGGTYQNLSGSSIIAGDFGKSGGTYSDAYHMRGHVQGYDDAQGLVTLWGDADYLDRDYLGTVGFDYNGYNAGGTGGFRSIMAGDITLDPLAWSANIVKDYSSKGLYTVDGNGIHQVGDVGGGLAGSLVSPWSGKTDFSYLGGYSPVGGRGPYVWTAPIYSYNHRLSVNETYDSGAFFGLVSGVWQDDAGIDARIYATYVSPTGKAGILKGIVGGAYFPDVSMYQGTGGWTAVELGTGSVADVAAISVTPRNDMNDTVGIPTLTGSFGGSGNIALAASGSKYQAMTYSASGQKWGIFQIVTGGTYTGTPSDTWYLGMDYHNTGDTLVTGTETVGSQWSAKKLLGESRGFAADISGTPGTWIGVGETVGAFNPSTTAWQAVQTAAYLETNLFLTLASTNAGRATLQQLNIPAIEVGKANLAGTYSGMGSLSVNMNNVTFFANSTGGPARLWATNGVTGSYDSAYGYAGKTVPLSGNGLNANFNVQTWNAAGGKWLSTVTNGNGTYSGAGSLNGSTVGFRGVAAGTINTGASTIAGTAAGTAK